MITLRPSAERLHTRLDWLDSRHTFSFGEHHDARFMGFRALRVINEDRVAPGQGFGTHPHRDMEIVTYVLEGVLEHQDSLGTGATIKPGDVQRMTAGTGVLHSEFNGSKTESVHFIQIWVHPDHKRLPPGYEQRSFPEADRDGQLRLIASPEGRDGSVTIHQDVNISAGLLKRGDAVAYGLKPEREAWVQIARGALTLNGVAMSAGDGAGVTEEPVLAFKSTERAEVLLFDLG
jgi:redox-sensitive bicupin YhaK (pirin superfamily)